MIASKRFATRAFDNTNPFGKHPASEIARSIVARRLAFVMIHRETRPKLAGDHCRPNQTEQTGALEPPMKVVSNGMVIGGGPVTVDVITRKSSCR